MLILTHENYHSNSANLDYMSRSQYMGFVYECEAKAIAKLSMEWVDIPTSAQEVGQYVHSWSAGTQDEFRAKHPSMFTKANFLRSEYLVANTMIDSLQEDPFVMSYLEGVKETILTGELYGVMWKIMPNVLNRERRRSVDLATTRSITEKVWDEETRKKVSFIEAYKYPLKMAIYSEIERLAMGRAPRDWSEFLIVAVSKEKTPDKAIINLTDFARLEVELAHVEVAMPRIIRVKAGLEEPIRCERCDYCRSTKVLTDAVHYSEL
ncbi:MAG: PD-(D/E)XK nuclease-like domain-containing protein [Desulfitobacterium hafniense]|nr:PD-(D/E)XK nuclease-like domain-containing protein [Desulfitobacterium hafniense]